MTTNTTSASPLLIAESANTKTPNIRDQQGIVCILFSVLFRNRRRIFDAPNMIVVVLTHSKNDKGTSLPYASGVERKIEKF